ncbi:membrane protein [Mesobacillus campisalis]|uniref:Probable lipid II flippase MurJ n=1 Tax=Mesobacillus campisalis TaxID=1408103 RepID=A0A0M2SVG2_9BACI|nr:murein biosynthesis integral membrane protein MurJ [Mesobacillus campisalis]KKK36620.1 membrane protein [Mesobacillus campisalis]
MKKTVIILMLLTMFSKVLGFIRDIALSFFYGASTVSDVYLISLTIPTVIFAIIGKGISTGFIPMYTRIEGSDGTKKAHQYTNNVVNLVLVICTFIFIAGLNYTEPLVKLFASGFRGDTLELAIDFTRISLAGVYFTGVIYVLTAFLQIKEVFIISALMGLPSNFIVIGSFYLSSETNIYILSFGSVLAIASQFILLSFYGYKKNYRYRPRLEIHDKNLRNMVVLALPAILGSSIAQINLLIDRTLASHIAVGGISALNYANTINLVVLGVAVSSITSVLYPKISKMAAAHDMKEMKKYLATGVSAINIIVLPATVGYMIFAEPIVQLLFGRGEFNQQAVSLTANALFYYSIGMIGLSLQMILSNAFYSLQDTKTPMVNSSICLLLNIVLNLILSRYMGIGGLALATSISAVFCSVLLFVSLRKRVGDFGGEAMLLSFIKILVASLIMGVSSRSAFELLLNFYSQTNSLFVSVFLGGVMYFVLISFMKIKEVNIVLHEMQNRIYKRKKAS